jgi:peptide/nickel transport system ATP-binding protein/oligopeptide transport system ATP-binding protein
MSLRALDRVSLTITPEETLALVGESGSGKTTLGHLIAGLREPSEGAIRFKGLPLDRRTRRAARQAIQMVFQDPFTALDPRMPVGEIVAEPLRIQRGTPASERQARAAILLAQVGLPANSITRYPHEFSGGQRQRIAIARALAPNPALIVADEPLSALDVSLQSQILNLFAEMRERRRFACLFITHDLGVVNHLADRVAVLYLGRLVEIAPRETVFERPAHPYTRALLDAVPRPGGSVRRRRAAITGEIASPLDPPPGCAFHPRCPRAQAVCSNVRPELAVLPGRAGQLVACHFPL